MTMGKKRKMMIGAAVVVVVCLSGVGVWKTGVFKNKDTSCGSYPISPPGPVMNATKTDGNYTINIKYILSHYSNNPYQLTSDDILWLNISKVWFVLGEEEGPGCPQFKTIEGIINGSINENNTTHGKLMDILNNASSNITYYDNDDDGAFDEEFKQNVGTLITTELEDNMEQPIISGIAFNRDEAKLTILGVPDEPGIASKILCPIGDANVEVDMIIQNVEEDGTTDFTFTVNRGELNKAKAILEATAQEIGAREVATRSDIVKVSIVGVGMRSHAGVASKMFTALADESINILMISTSEIKISVIIEENYLELAVRCLHTAFGLDREHGESSARA